MAGQIEALAEEDPSSNSDGDVPAVQSGGQTAEIRTMAVSLFSQPGGDPPLNRKPVLSVNQLRADWPWIILVAEHSLSPGL